LQTKETNEFYKNDQLLASESVRINVLGEKSQTGSRIRED
jgi:hypothetical protein